MAVDIVPTSTTDTSYFQRTQLDGVDYILQFEFNLRSKRWFFSLYDSAFAPILSGYKVSAGDDLLALVSDTRKPPGSLMVVDLPAQGEKETAARDPGIDELSDEARVALVYIDEAGVATASDDLADL